MSEQTERLERDVEAAPKAPYAPPELVPYGRAKDLIETSGVGAIDDGAGATNYSS